MTKEVKGIIELILAVVLFWVMTTGILSSCTLLFVSAILGIFLLTTVGFNNINGAEEED